MALVRGSREEYKVISRCDHFGLAGRHFLIGLLIIQSRRHQRRAVVNGRTILCLSLAAKRREMAGRYKGKVGDQDGGFEWCSLRAEYGNTWNRVLAVGMNRNKR